MKKTLTVTFRDINNETDVQVIGTLNPLKFNEQIIINMETPKTAISSRQLAEALAEVVNFQTPAPGETSSIDQKPSSPVLDQEDLQLSFPMHVGHSEES